MAKDTIDFNLIDETDNIEDIELGTKDTEDEEDTDDVTISDNEEDLSDDGDDLEGGSYGFEDPEAIEDERYNSLYGDSDDYTEDEIESNKYNQPSKKKSNSSSSVSNSGSRYSRDSEYEDEDNEDNYKNLDFKIEGTPQYSETSNKVLKSTYIDGRNLKDDAHVSGSIFVDRVYESDNTFDNYNTESIDKKAMERVVIESKTEDPVTKTFTDKVESIIMTERANRGGVLGNKHLAIKEYECDFYRITESDANFIFNHFVSYFTKNVDRRKFFYVRFLVQSICSAFDFHAVTKPGNERIEYHEFFNMLSSENKEYIKKNYY